MKFKKWFDSMQGKPYDSMCMFALDAWNAAIKSSTANDELLNIHTILMAPGDCPDSTDDDTLTVRLLKALIHDWHTATRERDHYKEMDALHIQSLGMKSVQLAEAKTPNVEVSGPEPLLAKVRSTAGLAGTEE